MNYLFGFAQVILIPTFESTQSSTLQLLWDVFQCCCKLRKNRAVSTRREVLVILLPDVQKRGWNTHHLVGSSWSPIVTEKWIKSLVNANNQDGILIFETLVVCLLFVIFSISTDIVALWKKIVSMWNDNTLLRCANIFTTLRLHIYIAAQYLLSFLSNLLGSFYALSN